ncbi:transcriptional regulator domain-containing protein [Pelagibacterium lentulum]|uniref:Transcriptional regulator-like domain-containing protein n=1 Tax=Pelagibacterium lentulum TaxID=2029865 RepID=A0A916RBT1_9HYPH|nr:DUF6499 domain-containing protein [Pelagibacterium lentulum]GGA48820.1 hypothetical protein GCM10011499_18320 [Pelagibacterium lentulum]
MSVEQSQWRSSENYDYVDRLSASDIAWEWLRRNPEYQRDYRKLSGAREPTFNLLERASTRWGLRFPRCTAPARN